MWFVCSAVVSFAVAFKVAFALASAFVYVHSLFIRFVSSFCLLL